MIMSLKIFWNKMPMSTISSSIIYVEESLYHAIFGTMRLFLERLKSGCLGLVQWQVLLGHVCKHVSKDN